jgi:hypothetical protein
MKKKLFFAAAFVVIAGAFGSCDKLSDCKKCQLNIYTDGVLTTEGDLQEYCGTELTAIENTDDVIIDNTRSTWECD